MAKGKLAPPFKKAQAGMPMPPMAMPMPPMKKPAPLKPGRKKK